MEKKVTPNVAKEKKELQVKIAKGFKGTFLKVITFFAFKNLNSMVIVPSCFVFFFILFLASFRWIVMNLKQCDEG